LLLARSGFHLPHLLLMVRRAGIRHGAWSEKRLPVFGSDHAQI